MGRKWADLDIYNYFKPNMVILEKGFFVGIDCLI